MNFNLNRNDLATKSTAQLAALFQDASRAVQASNAAIASAQSLLAMMRKNLAAVVQRHSDAGSRSPEGER